MKALPQLRALLGIVSLPLLALPIPASVSSQPSVSGPPPLAPEVRASLLQIAQDATLPAWQRDIMLRLSRGETPAAPDPVAGAGAAGAERSDVAADCEWGKLVIDSRRYCSVILDPLRDRMLVFGGSDGSQLLNDVWVLSLSDPPAWTQLMPEGTPPSPRCFHSAIYDPLRDRMVVFGGKSAAPGSLNDVWALSLAGRPAWTAVTPAGAPPPGRTSCSAIYDPVRDRLVLFGGADVTYFNDVWALSLADTPTWTELSPAGTPPIRRHAASAIYDPVRDRLVLFGGYYFQSTVHYLNDAWGLSLGDSLAWTPLTPAGTLPAARRGHSAIYDPVRDRMVVFGGQRSVSWYVADLWELTFSDSLAWHQISESGVVPSARAFHGAVYDPLRDRMVMSGGGAVIFVTDWWALSLGDAPAWTEIAPTAAPPKWRQGRSAIYDPVRHRMVVFGGYDWPTYYNEVWILSLADPPAWTAVSPVGTPPAGRAYHAAAYDPVRDRMLVHGGEDGFSSCRKDTWALSLADPMSWTEIPPASEPAFPRSDHTMIYDPVGDRMVVFGGRDNSSNVLYDVWALSLADPGAWTWLNPSGMPPAGRRGHSAIYDPVRHRMVVFGGYGAQYYNDVWALPLSGPPAWTSLAPTGTAPPGRYGHSAVYDLASDEMIVFGGTANGVRNDVWTLSLGATPAWRQRTPAGTTPGARLYHRAIYDSERDRMVVFGGSEYDDVWALWPQAVVGVEDDSARPMVSGLRPPAPNPSGGRTWLAYSIGTAGRVWLGIYDVSGRLRRRLVDGERRAGTESVVWDGTDESGLRLSAGLYFIQLAGPGVRQTRKVILLR
jgi:hypothetical protein